MESHCSLFISSFIHSLIYILCGPYTRITNKGPYPHGTQSIEKRHTINKDKNKYNDESIEKAMRENNKAYGRWVRENIYQEKFSRKSNH